MFGNKRIIRLINLVEKLIDRMEEIEERINKIEKKQEVVKCTT